MNTTFEAIKNLAIVFVMICLVIALGLVITFLVFFKQLPQLSSIQDYHPAVVSTVYSKDNQLIGEFYVERRYLTPLSELPEHVMKAFISAEDDRFFAHGGVDFQGILRASLANMRAGKVVHGGSTITQQVA